MLEKIVQTEIPERTLKGFSAIKSINLEFAAIKIQNKKNITTLIIINKDVKLLFSKKPFLLRR
tara:strand:- start:276 stop:464 length:189 start_codon:yes stop_codon:yes gene_type:complete